MDTGETLNLYIAGLSMGVNEYVSRVYVESAGGYGEWDRGGRHPNPKPILFWEILHTRPLIPRDLAMSTSLIAISCGIKDDAETESLHRSRSTENS